jgi:hypothetical protein
MTDRPFGHDRACLCTWALAAPFEVISSWSLSGDERAIRIPESDAQPPVQRRWQPF